MSDLSFAVVGTGALGGFYGGLLARSGQEVHFLARSDYDQIAEQGLRVETPLGDFQLPEVSVFKAAADVPPCDVVVVAIKTTQNTQLESLLKPLVGQQTRVLVLQNGLRPEAAVAAIVGRERVMGGVCFLCSNKVGPGHIRHLDYGRIVMGQHRPASDTQRGVPEHVQATADALAEAGIDVLCSEDQWLARWQKLMWNIPFNGLSVVLNAKSDALINHPESAALAESLMQEVLRAAEACGRRVPSETIEQMLENTRKMVPYDSSMRLDYLAGRPLEVEAIFGDPVRASEAAGYRPRQVRMLYEQLKFLDHQSSQARPENVS